MKFALALSAILLASSASAVNVPRQFGKGGQRFGGQNGKNGQNGQGNNKATSTAAAAAATSAAANGAQGGNGGNNGGNGGNNGDPQTSLTLINSVIATGFAQNGQGAAGSAAGQVASLTSKNNFINFCATVPNLPITNGQQIKSGSCNPAPMGVIAAQTKMPVSKFQNPTNGGVVKANTAFNIQMKIANLVTGNFVNAQSNYYSAPQQTDNSGAIIGHTHFVVESLPSADSTALPDNTKFAFFQGVNTAADGNGILTVNVADGLPIGNYRLASINAAANHQPVLVAVAQHGSLDDMVYFSVTADGQAANNGQNGNNTQTATNGQTANNGQNANNGQTANKGQTGQNANKGQTGGKFGGKFGGKGKRFNGFARQGLNRL